MEPRLVHVIVLEGLIHVLVGEVLVKITGFKAKQQSVKWVKGIDN